MLELKRDKKSVKINENVYELSEPSLREVKEYRKSSKIMNEDEDAAVDLMIKFISERGLPANVAESLTPNEALAIFNYLIPEKKS